MIQSNRISLVDCSDRHPFLKTSRVPIDSGEANYLGAMAIDLGNLLIIQECKLVTYV